MRNRARGKALRIAVASAALLGSAAALAQPADEYRVKAAFLYNFAKFVEWPAQAFARPDSDLLLCVIGDDPFEGALQETVAGKTVQDHRIGVRHIDDIDAAGCHILFIGSSELYRLRRVLAQVANGHVLTVGDVADFARQGSVVAFHVEAHKVRFTINIAAAEAAGIDVSSQLLKVAAKVLESSDPGW